MSEPSNDQFHIHCILCGKKFYEGSNTECGGAINGRSICQTNDIKQKLESRNEKKGDSELLNKHDSAV